MRVDVDHHVWQLIDRFHLHDGGVPVDLHGLEIIYPVRRRHLRLAGVTGFTSSRRDGGKVIVIDKTVSAVKARLVYAHEIGHILHGHPGTLRVMRVDEWFHDHQEREAWKVAAQLLVPLEEVAKNPNWSVAAVASLCEVPEWLVRLHLDMTP